MIPAAVLIRLATLGLDARLAEVLAEMLRAVEDATTKECVRIGELEISAARAGIDARRANEAERTRRYRERGGGDIPGELRQAVYERDGFACVYCGSEDHLQCDHDLAVSKGGPTTLDNLLTACRVCNAKKKDRDRKAFVRGLSKDKPDSPGTKPGIPGIIPRVRAFSIGEEVVLPPENATHSTPKGEKRSRRAARLPEDWKPTAEMRDYSRAKGMTELEIDRMGADMVGWSLSSPKGKKLDWKQTWEVWTRRFVDENPRQAKQVNGQNGGVGAALRDIQRKAIEREAILDFGSSGGSEGGASNLLLPEG